MKTTDELTNSESTTLIRLLAAIEANFEPVRKSEWDWQYCDRYLETGLVNFDLGGVDSASKKAEYRLLSGLQARGLAVTSNRMAGLTDEGLVVARSLIGAVQLSDCLPGVDFMLKLDGTRHSWRIYDGEPMGYFSETSLTGANPLRRWNPGACRLKPSETWVCQALVVLAVDGLIDHKFTMADWYESPLYFLTAKGRALAKKRKNDGTAKPRLWLKLSGHVSDEDPGYSQTWLSVRNAAPHLQPLDPNRINHRLSASMHPGD